MGPLSLKFGLCTLYQIHQKILACVDPPFSGNARISEAPHIATPPQQALFKSLHCQKKGGGLTHVNFFLITCTKANLK